jgi:hypothetical protein
VLSVEKARDFLMDSLNLPWRMDSPDGRPHFERWLRRWQRFFTFEVRVEAEIKEEDGPVESRAQWESVHIPREQLERFVPKLATALRRIWHEKDPRQRDWYFFRLRDEYHRMIVRAEHPYLIDLTDPDAAERLGQLERESQARGDVDASQRAYFFERFAAGTDVLEDVPRVCPFEAAVYWLQVNQKLMVYCQGPVCPTPYFFRTEKGQKYCSPECANPARREAKLKWWNENRKERRNKK